MIPNVNELNGGPLLLNLRERPQAIAILHPTGENSHTEGTMRLHRTPLGVLLAVTLRGLPEPAEDCPPLFALKGEGSCPPFATLPGGGGLLWGNLLLGSRLPEELIGQRLCVLQGDSAVAEGTFRSIRPYGPWQEELPEEAVPDAEAEQREETDEATAETSPAEEPLLPPAPEPAGGESLPEFVQEAAEEDSHKAENVVE